ncbi:MAG: hypothetical protein ACM3ME_08290 [Chloroflexota bacterium]|nr:hypothetical protein [Lentimicrobium sp.]
MSTKGENESAPKIFITDETKAVVEHYLEKQYARKKKRIEKKSELKPKDEWDPKTGKFVPKR